MRLNFAIRLSAAFMISAIHFDRLSDYLAIRLFIFAFIFIFCFISFTASALSEMHGSVTPTGFICISLFLLYIKVGSRQKMMAFISLISFEIEAAWRKATTIEGIGLIDTIR